MADGWQYLIEGAAIAAPGANTNIFATSPAPALAGRLRVTVTLNSGASVVNLIVTPSGGSPQTWGLNRSVALAAGDVYEFEGPRVPAGAACNLQVETNVSLHYAAIDISPGG